MGDPLMAGGRVAHGGSLFIRRLRMKPTRQMRGRDRRSGTWFDRELNCIAIEGVDFAQDTQEGGADRFELYPDSDEEGGAKGSSALDDDSEYVPETEPHDVVSVPRIIGLCDNHGRMHLGTALREWGRLISDVENESGKVDMESTKLQMDTVKLKKESVKVDTESDNFVMSADVQMDTVKLEETAKVQMGSVMVSRVTGLCDNHGRLHLGTALREWRRAISDVENDSAKVTMDAVKLEKESGKVKMDTVKLEDTAKVQMGSVKLEDTAKQSAKVEIDSVKVEMDSGKEPDDIVNFSDIETDDETCWFQDGVDLRGHSQVEDDDVNEQGLLVVFVIRVRQLIFIKYDVNSICIHANIVYDIIQGFLGLAVDHLNQMDGK